MPKTKTSAKDEVNFAEYQCCELCPRSCKVDRIKGQRGYCRETVDCRISYIGKHYGEEPSFTGTRGSGTIFFCGCSSHCFFCQNYQISIEDLGQIYSPELLLKAVSDLCQQQVHNINLVTPDHFWPHIEWLCHAVRKKGFDLPFILNCSGYQRADMIDRYAATIDIFMPDYKFSDPTLAKMCMGDERYPEIALNALKKMVELKGFLEPWDPSGQNTAKTGVLVRHLVLPGYVEQSIEALILLKKEFGRHLPLSIMSQFRPVPACEERHVLERMLTAAEFRRVADAVQDMGFEQVYLQSIPEEPDFLPNFKNRQPFKKKSPLGQEAH